MFTPLLLALGAKAYAAGVADLSAGDLIITEVMTNPSQVVFYKGEWFEIYNNSGQEVDLSGLVVSDGASQTFTVTSSLVVPAGGYVLFAARSNTLVNGGLPTVDWAYSRASFSLSSASDTVTLSYSGTTFDSVAWDNGLTFPDPYGSSLSLNPDALDATDNDDGSNWCEALPAYGDGDYGTPGEANQDCPVDLSYLVVGDLLITEVMSNPAASAYNKGEWFEIYNSSSLFVDVEGLDIYDSRGSAFTVSSSVLLRPGEYLVFAPRTQSSANGGLPYVDYRYIYSTEMILGSNDDLSLAYGPTLLDSFYWDSTSYPIVSGVALSLSDLHYDDAENDTPTSWCEATTTYGDGDYGTPGSANSDCDPDTDGDGYDEYVDCDDNDAARYPGADEICDEIDNDCDDEIDEDATDASTYYADVDYDLYGDSDPSTAVLACERPKGYRTNNLDCDDSNSAVKPKAAEICDGLDNDCDALVDDDDTGSGGITGQPTWYVDRDGDAYGSSATTQVTCDQPDGYAATADDCDDEDAAVNPGAEEICDEIDNDCDGTADEESSSDATTWYPDSDGDSYGDTSSREVECDQPDGYVADNTDCDDSDPAVNPAAAETCDGTDSNCSGDETDASDATTWYADTDSDTFGDAGNTTPDCAQPANYVADNTDCDDAEDTTYPGAEETCSDEVDSDCDGVDNNLCIASLATADVQLYGENVDDRAGYSVAGGGGDIDGDGLADVLVGARFEDSAASDAGAIYVVSDPELGNSTLGSAAAKITGEVAGDLAGISVDGGWDLNGDGFDDILIGAQSSDDGMVDAGAAYAVYGPVSGTLSLSAADAEFTGTATGDLAGRNVAMAGDVNDDGFADMLIGAQEDDTFDINAGAAYLVYGPSTGLALADADAVMVGETAQDFAGYWLDGAGDVNADGYDDVLVNAYRNDLAGYNRGTTYLLHGPLSGSVPLSGAAARLTGEADSDQAGSAVSEAGDVNDDGYADVLIGAQHHDAAGAESGAAYLVYGPFSGDIALSGADAKLTGESADDFAGRAVSEAGDVNLDGYGDILVGAKKSDANGTDSGATYLVFGPVSGTIPLSSADAIYVGEAAGDESSIAVANAGDVDGDGSVDHLIGAYLNATTGSQAGAAYLVFGGGY